MTNDVLQFSAVIELVHLNLAIEWSKTAEELMKPEGRVYRVSKSGERWGRADIFMDKIGHVFSRHTTATLMVAHGCDISMVQKLLRRNDIRTALRYVYVSDKTQREAYEKYLTI